MLKRRMCADLPFSYGERTLYGRPPVDESSSRPGKGSAPPAQQRAAGAGVRPGDYFAGGTALHLSHLIEDLESWYKLGYPQRAARMFHYDAVTPPERITVQMLWLNPNTTALDANQKHVIGHNEAVQQGSRTPEGQALQLRVDFNTMDPMDSSGPVPGVHFLSFSPGSEIFRRSRQAMDAVSVAREYGILEQANGINSFIRATRRQNFLVLPRAHRAFPLLELS